MSYYQRMVKHTQVSDQLIRLQQELDQLQQGLGQLPQSVREALLCKPMPPLKLQEQLSQMLQRIRELILEEQQLRRYIQQELPFQDPDPDLAA